MITISLRTTAVVAACGTLLASACTPPDATREDRLGEAYLRLLAAEDARPDAGPELATLTDASSGSVVFLRQTAIRALGRLENPDLVGHIAARLDDPAPAVRAEAANALAQSVHRTDGDEVAAMLLERAALEGDSLVLAALARSIGRSVSTPGLRARASATLVAMSRTSQGDAPLSTLTGVVLGFESLVRGAQGQGLSGSAANRLVELGRYGRSAGRGEAAARIRTIAYATLGQARRLDRALMDQVRQDPHESVRAVAGRYLDGVPPSLRVELIRRLLGDPSEQVAIEAVRRIAGEPRTDLYCRYLLAAAEQRARRGTAILALDALGRPCPQRSLQLEALASIASEITAAPTDAWHPHAHAFLSLARVAPDAATDLLPAFARHPSPFARAYAARGATLLGSVDALDTLARDANPNVRTAAIQGLSDLEGHDADGRLIAQLDAEDPQLLMTAAGLLEGSPNADVAAGALLAAFERISRAGRETWRDPRRALVRRLAELGDARLAPRLRPYLSDYDPVVAEDIAELLGTWEIAARATPTPLPREPLPTSAELAGLEGAQVVLHMRSGRSIVIELMPYAATANVFRFARLSESGYFDGLTFHRWAPNFVIQGGSPGANEYQGAGPYARDEVGLQPHWRGTVGISTRGRDTADAQIFINLIDNVRLDHDYTVVGRVVEGMDVVDAVLEGGVIERAEVRRPS